MPVFNCASTLGAAIRSVRLQTYSHWELLILDDGSTDDTVAVAGRFDDPRIRVLADSRNLGLACRLNQAVSIGKGEYFARMDGDDLCYPDRLERQVEFLQGSPEIDLVGACGIVFDHSGQAVGMLPLRQTHEEICARPWSGFYLAHPTWMGRMEWFSQHSYRESARRAQDQDLLLQTYRVSRFAALPEIALGYRQNSLSLKNILRGRYCFMAALLRQMLAGSDWRLAIGLVEQPLKALVDIVAITSGAGYRILRHRVLELSPEQRATWDRVWRACLDDSVS
jgi:glycosyltransferase involved in cell wall biosynthesis